MKSFLFIIIYFIAVNILGFALMGIDKRRARKNAFRIPEATLFAVAIIGGSLGSTIGMHVFRHKTKHWYFLFGMPIILIAQIVIFVLLYFGPIDFKFM